MDESPALRAALYSAEGPPYGRTSPTVNRIAKLSEPGELERLV